MYNLKGKKELNLRSCLIIFKEERLAHFTRSIRGRLNQNIVYMIENIGYKLRNLREERKKTLQEAAAALKISPSALGMYERGARRVSMEVLADIATYYGVDLKELTPINEEQAKLVEAVIGQNALNKDKIAFAKKRAGDNCELCGRRAPFFYNNGEPFLETYCLKIDCDGESETVAMLCPNCKRKMEILCLDSDYRYLEGRLKDTPSACRRD